MNLYGYVPRERRGGHTRKKRYSNREYREAMTGGGYDGQGRHSQGRRKAGQRPET